VDFDQHAERYQKAIEDAAGVSVERLAAEKARLVARVLNSLPDNPARPRVLDIGCGIGLLDRELQRHAFSVYGADTSERSLELARSNAPATAFTRYDGHRLPFPDASFDAAVLSNVLHHVAPDARSPFLAEMLRCIRIGGVAVVIEHNPLNPVTRHIVARCAFDADAVLLRCAEAQALLSERGARVAGRCYIGFSPLRHDLVEWVERAIAWLPFGAQYCVWGIKAPARGSVAASQGASPASR
jgi:ubiquinone/menaquinone biosynthesis C-methylase UbiE